MADYLLIESRDPFEINDVAYFYDLAAGLKERGNEVTLFLIQNGVFPVRKGSRSEKLAELASAGVSVLADDVSLRERGMGDESLVNGVESAKLDVVIDQLAEGAKTLWH